MKSSKLCTLYSVLCTLYSVLCTLYSVLHLAAAKSVWYKGNQYWVIRTGKMKIGQVWIDCIVYENAKCEIFVREKGDFNEKFKTAL